MQPGKLEPWKPSECRDTAVDRPCVKRPLKLFNLPDVYGLMLFVYAFLQSSVAACPSDLIGITVNSTIRLETTEACNFAISDCIFVFLQGTAICIQKYSSTALISDSTFQECSNTVTVWSNPTWSVPLSGAIYLDCLRSELTRCCGYKCYAYINHFSTIITSERQQALDISLFMCGNDQTSTTQKTETNTTRDSISRIMK